MAMSRRNRALLWAVGIFVLIQLVPFGRDHVNPKVSKEPAWDSAETRALAKRACFDCHSNETVWPWYANVAPVSWVVMNDVMGGRHHLNFSEWDREQKDADEAVDAVREGWMPLSIYLPAHPEARLSDAEKQKLAAGLERTLGAESGKAHDEDDDHDD